MGGRHSLGRDRVGGIVRRNLDGVPASRASCCPWLQQLAYLVVCAGLCVPIAVFSLFYVHPSERGLPLGQRYAVKAMVWMGIFSFIGNYWWVLLSHLPLLIDGRIQWREVLDMTWKGSSEPERAATDDWQMRWLATGNETLAACTRTWVALISPGCCRNLAVSMLSRGTMGRNKKSTAARGSAIALALTKVDGSVFLLPRRWTRMRTSTSSVTVLTSSPCSPDGVLACPLLAGSWPRYTHYFFCVLKASYLFPSW